MKLGADDKTKLMWAAGLGVVAVLVLIYQLMPSVTSTTSASAPVTATEPAATAAVRPAARRTSSSPSSNKKGKAPQSLDPTLHLDELAATEQLKYEGLGRNIFVSQAEVPIPIKSGATDQAKNEVIKYQPPTVAAPPPIPLKFFGFASKPGEPKKIFLSQGEDVFIAGEGEIVNRRYKVVRISNAAVDIQDMVSSGPPQSIPLTQG